MVYFKVVAWHSSERTDKTTQTFLRIVSILAKNWTWHLLNTSQRHYHPSQLAWSAG